MTSRAAEEVVWRRSPGSKVGEEWDMGPRRDIRGHTVANVIYKGRSLLFPSLCSRIGNSPTNYEYARRARR